MSVILRRPLDHQGRNCPPKFLIHATLWRGVVGLPEHVFHHIAGASDRCKNRLRRPRRVGEYPTVWLPTRSVP